MIDESNLTTSLVGAMIMFVLGLVVNQSIRNKKEKRDIERWQLGNIKDFFFEKYLAKEIKANRNAIKATESIDDVTSKDKYELALCIQQMGISAYLGIIPLEPILANNAVQIVSDWALVFNHINHVRSQEGFKKLEVPLHRRHGEWLALICYQWIRYQDYITAHEEYESYFDDFLKKYEDENSIIKRELLIFNSEKELLNSVTISTVNKVRKKFLREKKRRTKASN